VCGDLVDAFPEKWPDIRQRQEDDLMRAYEDLDADIPMVCVCGNHDVGNTPTKDTVAGYRSTFGDDYFSFWHSGVCFVVINSQYYEDASRVRDIAAAQEAWLDERLASAQRAGAKHIMIFQHIPWFVAEPDEEKFYFNVENETRQRMLAKFYENGVRKIFCGHYHRNAGGWYRDLELIVTTAIGCQIGPDTHGMRLVKVKEGSVDHKFYSLDDFPKEVEP